MKRIIGDLLVLLCVLIALSSCSSHRHLSSSVFSDAYIPKREFRGAWMQAVNGQYVGMTAAEQQQRLIEQLDVLQQVGVNAVFFQVRPAADALYYSPYEPWSRFLTGEQGKAPDIDWDPLQFMIGACHARGMELHAWINPYRAKLKGDDNSSLSAKHPYNKWPERFVEYDGLLFFNPALQVNRDYICAVVSDIVRRYDVDGLHVDDYFYPYPAAGKAFPDDSNFIADPRGFRDKNAWRRDNVDLLVQQLSKTIHGIKPWVKFGVSPFGIYHNASAGSDVPGSETRGLQNYDDLYADILLWVREGWVDYTIPQLYWQIGHPTADYTTLVSWWAENAGGRPLYIGQDLERSLQYTDPADPTRDQLLRKFALQRSEATSGYCWWYADALRQKISDPVVASEVYAVAHPSTFALQPLCPFLDNRAPGAVRKPALIAGIQGPVIYWTAPAWKHEMDRPIRYVIYRFQKGEKVDISDPRRIVAFTTSTFYELPADAPRGKFVYVITALDRLQNESKPVAVKVSL